jgi:hypothetical protein
MSGCSSPFEVFVLKDVTGGPLNTGDTYNVQTDGFNGCATVVTYSGIGMVYSSISTDGPYTGCSACVSVVSPTPTPTPTPTPIPCLDTNWITWTGASGGTFSLIGGGTVTLTSSSTGSTYSQPVFQYSRLSCPDKNPSGNVQALENEGLYTYTFSQPVTNPILAVYTLGRDIPSPITASLSADTPFTVYCSATSNPSYVITYDLLNQSFLLSNRMLRTRSVCMYMSKSRPFFWLKSIW